MLSQFAVAGFFRRTIRRGYKYTCRFKSECFIDKREQFDNRAVCRFCRYTRCIRAGMRVEQVQNERDVIGKRVRTASTCTTQTKPYTIKRHQSADECSSKQSSPEITGTAEDIWDCPETLIDALLKSEKTINSLRESVIKQTGNVEYTIKPEEPVSWPCSQDSTFAKGLSPLAVTTVLNTRRRIFSALEHYVRTRKNDEKTRLGDLMLFVLSPLSVRFFSILDMVDFVRIYINAKKCVAPHWLTPPPATSMIGHLPLPVVELGCV
ncbi:zinc finger, C4 type [Ancylostoma ceylanicum]|uniref:Zinc finger, C4 type n=1 Tax=Ancylostoma ceylanicum TaxID=53326 RepID=A0A0D6LT54_9BILA|nr:zinc finger, C4 type [Ancylostoma ceylanicum]